MKKLRMLSLAFIAFAIVGVLSGCQFALNAEQKKVYDEWIDGIYNHCKNAEMPAQAVKEGVQEANENYFYKHDFKIIDLNEGHIIKRGSSRLAIEARFPPKRLK